MSAAATNHYPRDLAGYGDAPPHPHWPGGARIAVQFVLNLEEGGEMCVLHGDPCSESFLSEMDRAEPRPDARHMSMESLYEYGTRAGAWRVLDLFRARDLPLTVFAVATAAQRNPQLIERAVADGHEVAEGLLGEGEREPLGGAAAGAEHEGVRAPAPLVVGQDQRFLLRLREVPELDHRHRGEPELARRHHPAVPGDDAVGAVDEHRVCEAELPDRAGDQRHLLVGETALACELAVAGLWRPGRHVAAGGHPCDVAGAAADMAASSVARSTDPRLRPKRAFTRTPCGGLQGSGQDHFRITSCDDMEPNSDEPCRA